MVSIPDPCGVAWGTMTPSSNGRFCKVCAKNVVDFTTFTDTQIRVFLTSSEGELCGHFYQKQLKRLNAVFKPELREFSLLSLLLSGSLLVGIIGGVHAESQQSRTGSEQITA